MTARLSINFITGLDSVAVPNQSLFYLMAEVDDPQVFNDEMNSMQDGSVQGFAHQSDRREAPPQVPVGSINFITGLDLVAVPNQSQFYLMAEIDDPRSSGGKFIHPDRYNTGGPSNYPPQIGGGVV